MRRIATLAFQSLGILIITGVILLCSITTFLYHTNNAESTTLTTNCSAACNSHEQPLVSNNRLQKEDEDKDEPNPPAFSWPQPVVSLTVFYSVTFILALWISGKQRNILLTTHLRI